MPLLIHNRLTVMLSMPVSASRARTVRRMRSFIRLKATIASPAVEGAPAPLQQLGSDGSGEGHKCGVAATGELFEQRAVTLPAPALRKVCLALALQNKNLYNTTHFAVNNVLTAHEAVGASEGSGGSGAVKTYRLKPKLHDNQTLALARFNRAIEHICCPWQGPPVCPR